MLVASPSTRWEGRWVDSLRDVNKIITFRVKLFRLHCMAGKENGKLKRRNLSFFFVENSIFLLFYFYFWFLLLGRLVTRPNRLKGWVGECII